jgi:hypothetical protein
MEGRSGDPSAVVGATVSFGEWQVTTALGDTTGGPSQLSARLVTSALAECGLECGAIRVHLTHTMCPWLGMSHLSIPKQPQTAPNSSKQLMFTVIGNGAKGARVETSAPCWLQFCGYMFVLPMHDYFYFWPSPG